MTEPNLHKLLLALQKAQEEYDAARKEALEARRLETQTLNDLNQAQKAFDAAVEKVRSNGIRVMIERTMSR